MGQIYLKFRTDDLPAKSGRETDRDRITRTIENALEKLFTTILPQANPDFEDKLRKVNEWILEVEDEDGGPLREIGLDSKGHVIAIMPWRNNCGFWTDSNVQLEEFAKSREFSFGDKDEFERLWNRI